VEPLRDLAQAEAGQLRLAIETLDATAVLHEAAASVESSARSKAVRIVVSPVAGPVGVLADGARLRQVLINLLDNSIRYAPADTAVVMAVGDRTDAEVDITVSDEGAGVAEDHLPKLFDRFFRADESRDRRTGGAGLGLAIVEQLVTLQGGTVTAANLPPRGFRVTVTLRSPHR
jgi:two-component system sensor histidine kinase BaeS